MTSVERLLLGSRNWFRLIQHNISFYLHNRCEICEMFSASELSTSRWQSNFPAIFYLLKLHIYKSQKHLYKCNVYQNTLHNCIIWTWCLNLKRISNSFRAGQSLFSILEEKKFSGQNIFKRKKKYFIYTYAFHIFQNLALAAKTYPKQKNHLLSTSLYQYWSISLINIFICIIKETKWSRKKRTI